MSLISRVWLRMRRSVLDLSRDASGVAAIEFAIIVPVMLVLFFGTVEYSRAVAVDRKVTLVARALSDLTSQNMSVTTNQLSNIFNAGIGILSPYSAAPVNARIVELYIDANLVVKTIWTATSGTAPPSGTVVVPTALKIAGTYLIYSEVSYNYVPIVNFVMPKVGINLNDLTYTRPRQSLCVLKDPSSSSASCPVS